MIQYPQNNSVPIIQRARQLFHTGRKFTATELNNLLGFNDSRKVISELRAVGMNIQDYRLTDGRKIYYLVEDKRQLKLPFAKEPQLLVDIMREQMTTHSVDPCSSEVSILSKLQECKNNQKQNQGGTNER